MGRLLRQRKPVAPLQLWRLNKTAFWQAYKPHGRRCPLQSAGIAAHFDSKRNSYPAAPPSDPDITPAQPASATTIGDGITSTSPPQIIAAINKMGKTAAGPGGIPSSLIKPALPKAQACPPHPQLEAAPPAGATDTDKPLPRTKDAIYLTAQGLHKLYTCISSSGPVPEQWRAASWRPPTRAGTRRLTPLHRHLAQLSI